MRGERRDRARLESKQNSKHRDSVNETVGLALQRSSRTQLTHGIVCVLFSSFSAGGLRLVFTFQVPDTACFNFTVSEEI